MTYKLFTSALGTQIYNAECAQFLKDNSVGFYGQFDMVCTDPPFNIGQGYDVCDDRRPDSEYGIWFRDWLHQAAQCLRNGGVFAINVPDALIGLTLQSVPFSFTRIDWIIWHYKFGECVRSKFISSHTHCLVFRQCDIPHTFNDHDILVNSDRKSKYNDRRTVESATPGLRVPLDVWSIDNDGPYWGRIVGANEEKIDNHPNQLPELYMARLIRAYTNPGDLILEPFGGTGTTTVVAEALGRRCVTLELSEQYCVDIVARLKKGVVRKV